MSVVYHSSLKFYILPCVQSKKFGAVETNSVESKLFWVDLASLIIILFHLITHFFLALIFLIPAINLKFSDITLDTGMCRILHKKDLLNLCSVLQSLMRAGGKVMLVSLFSHSLRNIYMLKSFSVKMHRFLLSLYHHFDLRIIVN